MATANEELVELVTKQAMDLLAEIRKDVEETKALTEEDRKNCMAICHRVETEHTRLKIEFLNESLILIDQALETSDQQKLIQIHEAWSLVLKNVTHQCKTLVGPLMEVLRVLSRQDKNLGRKYAGLLAGAVVSSILCGAAVVVLIAHAHPGCCLQLATEAVLAVSVGALIAIAIALGCIAGCISIARLRIVYRKCSDSVRLILVKWFPHCFDGSSKDPSDSELANVIEQSINTLNIKQDIWRNRTALEMLKRWAKNQRDHQPISNMNSVPNKNL
ncbi:unnamed protein product [Didymodactylos carnosus]|uniref:Transmembrane protein n=1 Tax=Didymodactylos carnosus TaxID=1234261 RepID=A0A813WVD3_9BILA|nr:unnamed protein product [Didymodactylos carnosus]CAF3647997.1 unnamed protein product [Didymodactylos carnosus]